MGGTEELTGQAGEGCALPHGPGDHNSSLLLRASFKVFLCGFTLTGGPTDTTVETSEQKTLPAAFLLWCELTHCL